MSYVLALALIVALHAVRRLYGARREIAHELLALRLEYRERWQALDRQLDAEEQVWHRAAEVHRSVRQAMRTVISRPAPDADVTTPEPAGRARIVVHPTTWGAHPLARSASLRVADDDERAPVPGHAR
jgi:hypothetical protein